MKIERMVNNDIYFFELCNDKLLINDNYEGILIYDNRFLLLKKIKLVDDLVIDFCIKNRDDILLICTENVMLIYINLINYEYKIVNLNEYKNVVFSQIYEWNNNEVILSDYRNNYFKLNLESGRLIKIISEHYNIHNIIRIKNELNKKYLVHKLFIIEKKAVVESNFKNLELIECFNGMKSIKKLTSGNFYDFEIANEYIAEIGEGEIIVTNYKTNAIISFVPQKGYYFMRGKFMITSEDIYIYLLSGNKADETINLIEKICITK